MLERGQPRDSEGLAAGGIVEISGRGREQPINDSPKAEVSTGPLWRRLVGVSVAFCRLDGDTSHPETTYRHSLVSSPIIRRLRRRAYLSPTLLSVSTPP